MADNLSAGPRRLLGLAMVGLVVALLALCVAVYAKVFTSTVPVTMQIDQVDNSFAPQAEVRLRGVTVGEVKSVSTDGKVATVSLALQPDLVPHIPSNVSAQLLPKSLFGERYVALEVPPDPSATPIRAGAVIPRDRSSDTIQTEQVFNNLLPLLQAVKPADLANTLGALSQALSGRGAQLGDTITLLHQYLSRFNPALPDLTADLAALPKFTDTYSKAAPDLIEGLKTLTTTTKTLDDKKHEFAHLYSTVTDTSDDLREFLEDNKHNLINLVDKARPTLDLAARYSPEYVCLFQRLAAAIPLGKAAFGEGTARPALRVDVEVVANRGKFKPHLDEPDYTDNRGPACYNNTPPIAQYPGGPAMDGSTHPPASAQAVQLGKLLGTDPTAPAGSSGSTAPALPALPLLGGTGASAPDSGGPLDLPANKPDALGAPASKPQALGSPVPAFTASSLTIANSAPERQLVAGLLADMTGTDPATMPAWSSLMVGTLLRGTEVQVR
ncbi:MAG: phospholipid/cholesterol/gamma-HCH transport system substrate-binding protein [Pseudonocardiales bacterium]|nr:phospholipid/cholesterol/gamma-HCH transport system substrate-binding protein [Pseudonocardiales bacterium]